MDEASVAHDADHRPARQLARQGAARTEGEGARLAYDPEPKPR